MEKAFQKLFGYSNYQCFELLPDRKLVPAKLEQDCEFREIFYSELCELSQNFEYDISLDFVEMAKERGDRGFGVFTEKEMLGYCFFTKTSPVAIDEQWKFEIPEGVLYIFKMMVCEKHRGKGIGGIILTSALQTLQNGGPAVSFVDLQNRSSMKLFQKSGFHKIGLIRILKIMKLNFIFQDANNHQYGYVWSE